MKNIPMIFCLGILLILVGCAVKYEHPDKPESMWDTDYHMCEVEVDYATDFHQYTTTASRPHTTRLVHYSPRYKELLRECMERKGYTYEDDLKKILFD